MLCLSAKSKQKIPQWPLSDLRELIASPYFKDVLSLLKTFGKEDALEKLHAVQKTYPTFPPPLLSGHDLQALGYSSGQALGDRLKDLRKAQLNEQITTKAQALTFVKEKIQMDKTKA